jgi:probable rRNA maturation factor
MRVAFERVVEDKRWTSYLRKHSITRPSILNFISLSYNEACRGKSYKKDVLKYSDLSFTLVFTDDSRICDLNYKYRFKNKPTNVLSFENMFQVSVDKIYLGEVFISLDTLLLECDRDGILFKNHVFHMLVHGFLHLLGFDHEKDVMAEEMESIEARALSKIGISNPYKE